MGVTLPKRLSLDTNVLFDLADEEDFAHDFRETYQRRDYSLAVCPTVVAELSFFRAEGDTEERRLASLALTGLASWDIQVFPLSGVQIVVAKRFASILIARGFPADLTKVVEQSEDTLVGGDRGNVLVNGADILGPLLA